MSKCFTNVRELRRLAVEAKYSTASFARRCGMSMRKLLRYFRQRFRMTPKAWLTRERLMRAARLLRQDGSIADVAFKLGYKQISHFSREFTRSFGVNPTAWAARNRSTKKAANR
jgi:transcriptional regulator GlxA family with amidase domain